MLKYIAMRLLHGIPVIIGVTLLCALMMYIAPGSPASMDINPRMTPETVERWKHIFDLDKPFHERYFLYWKKLLTGELTSVTDGQPVWNKILERLPFTLLLNLVATMIVFAIAIPTGIFSAVHRYKPSDHIITVLCFIGISIPSFTLAYLLILLFVKVLGIPVIGAATFGMTNTPAFAIAGDRIWHLFLPSLILAVGEIAVLSRYVRGSMLEVARQDYIRTAWAKGLSHEQVWYKHAFRNALLPLVTMFGFLLPDLLGGAVIIETIFAWPGLGRLGYESLVARDYPVIMTLNLVAAILVFLGNMLADILYAVADPRIRYD